MGREYLNESLRTIAKGAGFVIIGSIIGMIFGYLSRMIIARLLGASDYCLISLGFAAMSIAVTLSMVGMQSGIIRYISFYKGKEDNEKIRGVIISAIKVMLLLGIISGMLLFIFSEWISINIFHDPNLTPILRIFSIAIPFSGLAQIFISATVGFQEMKYQVYIQSVFQEPFKLGAIVVLIAMGLDVIGATWGWVLSIIVMPFLAFYYLEKRVFSIFNHNSNSGPMGRELLSFSFPLLFSGIAGLVMGWTDTLLLGYFASIKDVGIYNAALPTAQIINTIPGAFSGILFPVITELYARDKMEEMRSTYNTVTKWMLLLVFPVFLMGVLFSSQVIEILFGSEYVEGAAALSILMFGFMINAAIGPASAILYAYGRTKTIMIIGYIGATVNIIINILLIPIYGINGAAIATVLSFCVLYILTFLFGYKVSRIQPFRLSYLKIILSSLIAISMVYLITKYIIGVSLFSLVVVLLFYLILYFFLVFVMKIFEEEDLMIIKAIIQRFGIKSNIIKKIIT